MQLKVPRYLYQDVEYFVKRFGLFYLQSIINHHIIANWLRNFNDKKL